MRMSRRRGITRQEDAYTWKYSGAHSSRIIEVDGVQRRLVTITGDGTLTIEGDVTAGVCLIGGGACGGYGAPTGQGYAEGSTGGGGGYMTQDLARKLASGDVAIGKGGAPGTDTSLRNGFPTTFQGLTANGGLAGSRGGDGGGRGGSGGGGGGYGDGQSKYPFGIADLRAHCAGGGQGAMYQSSNRNSGGVGGTNGGNGGYGASTGSVPGEGGDYGGGRGGTANGSDAGYGEAATFYGGGGGGGGSAGTSTAAPGGAGYQGVVYILLPDGTEEAAA